MSFIEKNHDSPILKSPNRASGDSFVNVNQLQQHKSHKSSKKPTLKHLKSVESTKTLKRRSKFYELTSTLMPKSTEEKTNSTYLENIKENPVSADISMTEDPNKSFTQSVKSISSSISNIVPPSMDISTPKRQSKIFMATIQSPSSAKFYEGQNSPYDNSTSRLSSSLPPSTPMKRVVSNSATNISKRSSIYKQKNQSLKITGKPILTLNDVNGPLDILRAKRCLVHYIPLSNSIVEPLSVTEVIDLKNGTLATKEVPLLLLTYTNQEKDVSSACQVLLQMTNIGLGTVMKYPASPSTKTPTTEQKKESVSPLLYQRRLSTKSSPILSSGQSNTSSVSSTILDAFDREGQLIESEIIDWGKHIQQSSNIVENPNKSFSCYTPDKSYPKVISDDEDHKIMDYRQYSPAYNSNRHSIALNSLQNNNASIFSTPNNESPILKQEIVSAVSNRSFYSDIPISTPFYESNNESYPLESLLEEPTDSSHESMKLPLRNETDVVEKTGIEIRGFTKHYEMNSDMMSKSLPYDNTMKSSPFISNPDPRFLDDSKIKLSTHEKEIDSDSLQISQEAQKNKLSKLNTTYEESLNNEKEMKLKDKELQNENVLNVFDKTPSMDCEGMTILLLPLFLVYFCFNFIFFFLF